MSKNLIIILVALCIMPHGMAAQTLPLENIRICLDPGHGGEDSDDRPTDLGLGTIYYESNANWDAVLHLETLLTLLGANIKLTKTTNDPEDANRDPSLADRVQIANTFGADYFHSFHTNGFSNPQTNYTLVLYPGPQDGIADFPESIEMAGIMSQELFQYARTTGTFARADIPFTGFTNGLGVLNNLSMPGTLSEVSFHSNVEEGRRLMNTDYLRAAAWGLTKSFLRYYEEDLPETGEIGGVVVETNGRPLNGIEVILDGGSPQQQIYYGDDFLNGFYFFDSLQAGNHEVLLSKFGYDSQKVEVTVDAGQYTELDFTLTRVGGAPTSPKLISISSHGNTGGIEAKWQSNPEVSLLGYRLYYAADDDLEDWVLAADEQMTGPASTFIALDSYDDFLSVPNREVYHFKLTAVTESGAESGASDVYSRNNGKGSQSVLLVDGFDRITGSYTENVHHFAAEYAIALREGNTSSISTISNEGTLENPALLETYDLVLWFFGDESTAGETLSSEEQTILKNYLQTGGKLIITGSEIAWDLDHRGSIEDRLFYHQFLKARYQGDGTLGYAPASGISETLFENIIFNFGINYQEDFPDELIPNGGSEILLGYNSPGGIAAIGYKGPFPDGQSAGGLINFGFALETGPREDLQEVLRQSLIYLGVGSPVSSTNNGSTKHASDLIVQITPNPSAQNALLQVQHKGDQNLKEVYLTIFSLEGSLIFEKTFEVSQPVLNFELPSRGWPRGNYLIRVRSGRLVASLLFVNLD